MTNQAVLIGLDGATFKMLDMLMEQGVMPFLKSFVAVGRSRGFTLRNPSSYASCLDIADDRQKSRQSQRIRLLSACLARIETYPVHHIQRYPLRDDLVDSQSAGPQSDCLEFPLDVSSATHKRPRGPRRLDALASTAPRLLSARPV